MYGQGLFFQAFVYLSAAVISVPIAKRLGLGSVLGYLIAGMLIGPFGLGLVGEEGQDVMHFAEFGVVMMLFLIGLELRPTLLWRMRGPILGVGGLQVGVTTAIVTAIGIAVSLPWGTALAVGMILALSSTAIVLQTLAEKGLMGTDGGQSSFAVLLFQDIAVIPMLALLPLLASSAGAVEAVESKGHGEAWVQSLPAWAETLAVLGAVAALVVGGRFLLRSVFRFIARTHLREIFTAAALLLVIGIALLMAEVGLSPALGTFVAGVVLANSEYRHELEADIDPFKGLLLGVFFIAVGASVDFGLIAARPGLVAGLVGALILLKFAVLFALGRFFRMGLDQNLLFAFSLAQGGEFAFVLFSFATQHGVVGASVANPLIAVVALSMAATPLLMLLNERLVQPRFGTRERATGKADAIDELNPVIIAGFGRFGSVVGRLLRANGVGTTVLEYDSDHVEVLRKLGLKVFYGDASRHDLLRAAGAEQARLMILALDDHERTLGLVGTIKKHFPHLTLLARAAGRPEAYQLIDAGVQHVYRETLDTSLRLGVDALRLLGARSYRAHRAARTFRRHDEESGVELAQMRHDRGRYLSEARQRIQALEQTLLDELRREPDDRDAGWDTESLRDEFGRLRADDG
jgi:monovalent cation:proton antiporter-2 (CPA2) family protein